MALTVKLAGPNRMLPIVIDERRADCDLDLMASIGHELWHAIEVLREPSLRSYAHLYIFFSRDGRHRTRQFVRGVGDVFNRAGDEPCAKRIDK